MWRLMVESLSEERSERALEARRCGESGEVVVVEDGAGEVEIGEKAVRMRRREGVRCEKMLERIFACGWSFDGVCIGPV